jgi:hypothetical protein
MGILRLLSLLTVVSLGSLATSQGVAQTPASDSSKAPPSGADHPSPTGADDKWHIAFTPYLWFSGMHGTTGLRGFDASVHASAGDMLSHFNMGLMGTTELRKNRFVFPIDLMWARLTDDHAFPENRIGINSVSFRVGQFLLTPAPGYRVVDKDKVKIDGLAGFRYWYLGQKFKFSPSIRGGVSESQDWVDAIGGARFILLPSPKVSMTILGDAGGGGASPDYEVVGLLGWKVHKNIRLLAGWRYLDVHYRNSSNQYLYDVASSGSLFGATFDLK